MAKFDFSIPKEIMDDVIAIEKNADAIFGGMTQAGAEVVASNVRSTVPISKLAEHVRISRVYKTPSDDGINTKVYFSGYFKFPAGRTLFARRAGGKVYTTDKGIPAAFVANMYEYGTRQRTTEDGQDRGRITKKPFFRKAFKKDQIEQAMLEAQKELSGGLLDE